MIEGDTGGKRRFLHRAIAPMGTQGRNNGVATWSAIKE
jgi:hypothetical protein